MTEEEIEANALADPDNPPLTDEELALMRFGWGRKRIRERLKPTQEQFAERFEIPSARCCVSSSRTRRG